MLAASPAAAKLTLRQKSFAKQQDRYFKRHVDATRKKCGVKIKAVIDWESFKKEIDKQLDKKQNVGFSGFCAQPLGVMWQLCAVSEGKHAIQRRIKSYVCRFGGKGKFRVRLKGSTLMMWVDWKATNIGQKIHKYLGKHL
jgi:hypothetical protein